MTEKRFTYEYDKYDGNLFDNKYNTFYHIEDSEENIELLCKRLNENVDYLKELNIINNDLIDFNEKVLEINEKIISSNNKKHKVIVELGEENNELKRILKRIVYKIEYGSYCATQNYHVTVGVTPKMYDKLKEIIKSDEMW